MSNDRRATFLFYPPTDRANAWHMTFDGFRAALEQAFPDAFTRLMPTSFRGGSYLEFEVATPDNPGLRGIATMPVEECGCITLTDASPTDAAHIAHWLRDTFISSPDLIRFSSEAALESGDESHWELPVTGDTTAIEAALREHVDAVG
ncbi:hypothetical protein ADK76_29020 [Streptomyces griseoflavus]|uniref:hypothetical protein n=1 Tax=Streptomyces rimosus TaxID=1927 RepID=UPI0004C86EC2|nr:hypothetical protein [Streptomyces rimosus]KOG53156.1 hypothetical protein ADK76_29020 [Streptomyces griseoflavus]